MKKIYILVVMLFVFFHSCLFSEVYRFPKDNFQITLPSDWEKISKDVINEYTEGIRQMLPDLEEIPEIDYMFQLKNSEYYFDFPYLAVEVKKTGRISESSLKNWGRTDFSDVENYLEEKTNYLLSDVRFGEFIHDSEKNILWNKGQLKADYEDAIILMGLIPTEEGLINVYGYSYIKSYKQYSKLFINIIESVVVSEEIKYQKKVNITKKSKTSFLKKDARYGAFFLFGLYMLIISYKKRKKKLQREKELLALTGSKNLNRICPKCYKKIIINSSDIKNGYVKCPTCNAKIDLIKWEIIND